MLILIMSVSGSLILLAILLCAVLGKSVFSSAWIYNMLKLDLLFFCLPLPMYNSGYKSELLRILGIPRRWNMTEIAIENCIGIEESGRLHVNFQTYIIVIWTVWVCGLLFSVIRNLRRYREAEAVKGNRQVSRSDYLAIFDRVKKEVGVKSNVTLLCAGEAATICTMGVFRKYVIVPESGLAKEEIYYALKHELIHAKRSDVAWRYLSLFVVLLHWFNPLAYLYFYVMSVYCEQSCDAIVVEKLDKAARKRYGNLIINMAREDEVGRWRYRTNLDGSKNMMKLRLIHMLESRKRNRMERAASLLLGAVILFGGSLTVCAYENPQVITGGDAAFFERLSDEAYEKTFVVGEIRFSDEEVLDFQEFLGDDGSCYHLPDAENDNIERVACTHAYVSGYYKDHHKNSDGSCRTVYHHADRCTKCGNVVVKDYWNTDISTKCTH